VKALDESLRVMADWELWIGMARSTSAAAEKLRTDGYPRDAASRFYYAAFYTATALLLYRGLTPPQEREGWSHEQTPELVMDELVPVLPDRDRRYGLYKRLRILYGLRLTADYRATRPVNDEDVTRARRDAGYIMSVAGTVLPEPKGIS